VKPLTPKNLGLWALDTFDLQTVKVPAQLDGCLVLAQVMRKDSSTGFQIGRLRSAVILPIRSFSLIAGYPGSLPVFLGKGKICHCHLRADASFQDIRRSLDWTSPNWDNEPMRRILAAGEKPLNWVESSKRDFLEFPHSCKLRLAYALNQVLEQRKLTQAEAAKVLGIGQPKVSALRRYKLAGFSVERLMTLLTALDQDVEIVIKRKPRSRRAGRIRIVAA
jgi:predicted XRE-type DNA-binding protein